MSRQGNGYSRWTCAICEHINPVLDSRGWCCSCAREFNQVLGALYGKDGRGAHVRILRTAAKWRHSQRSQHNLIA